MATARNFGPIDPTNPRYKIWSLKRDETTTDDYKNWPVDLGAPYTTDEYGVKVPAISGDQMYWFVMNDMDASRTAKLYGTAPMGIEVQCSIKRMVIIEKMFTTPKK